MSEHRAETSPVGVGREEWGEGERLRGERLDYEAALQVLDEHGLPIPGVDDSWGLTGGRFLAEPPESVGWQPIATAAVEEAVTLMMCTSLAGADPARVKAVIAASARFRAFAEATLAAGITRLVEQVAAVPGLVGGGITPEHATAQELVPVLGISPESARNRIEDCARLCARPRVWAALRDGRLDKPKALSIVDAVEDLSPEAAEQVETKALTGCEQRTHATLGRLLRRARLAADPHAGQRRHDTRTRDRAVTRAHGADGMGELRYTDRSDKVEALYQHITHQAKTCLDDLSAPERTSRSGAPEPADVSARKRTPSPEPGQQQRRTIGQARADVLGDIALAAISGHLTGTPIGTPTDRAGGTARSPRVLLSVVASIQTLLGLSEAPGEIPGQTTLPAHVVRELAADATWRRLVTDQAGNLIHLSSTRYQPPERMRDLVRTRDKTCRAPGCRRPALTADLDHCTPYPEGPTTPGNLCGLCRIHHRYKTFAGVQLSADPYGNLTWRTPLGQTVNLPVQPLLDPDYDLAPF